MPIRIDNDLPAKAILEEENIFVMDKERACTQDIRPLRIAILNLMPNKLDTELHLLRSLSNTPLQLDITFLQTESYVPTHVSESHLEKFYHYFSEIRDHKFDGLIITGAPVELKEFEEVAYWDEVAQIMEWSKTHVTSTLHICWAAQAGLYYHYGIRKHVLDKKISGVYEHHPLHNKIPLVRGFDDMFYVPHSRNTGVDGEAIRRNKELTVAALLVVFLYKILNLRRVHAHFVKQRSRVFLFFHKILSSPRPSERRARRAPLLHASGLSVISLGSGVERYLDEAEILRRHRRQA